MFKDGKPVAESIRRPMELLQTVLRQIAQASTEGASSHGEASADWRIAGSSPDELPGSEVMQAAEEASAGGPAAEQRGGTAGLGSEAEVVSDGNGVRAGGTAAAEGAPGEKAGAVKGSFEAATANADTNVKDSLVKTASSSLAPAPQGPQGTADVGESGSRAATTGPQAPAAYGATASLDASEYQGDSASLAAGKDADASELSTAIVARSGSFKAGKKIRILLPSGLGFPQALIRLKHKLTIHPQNNIAQIRLSRLLLIPLPPRQTRLIPVSRRTVRPRTGSERQLPDKVPVRKMCKLPTIPPGNRLVGSSAS